MQTVFSLRACWRVGQFIALSSFLALMGCDDGGEDMGSDGGSVADVGVPPCGPLATLPDFVGGKLACPAVLQPRQGKSGAEHEVKQVVVKARSCADLRFCVPAGGCTGGCHGGKVNGG